MLFILTTTDDGAVPVQYRCEAGNANDLPTHIAGAVVRIFEPELAELQRQVLALLGVPETAYRNGP